MLLPGSSVVLMLLLESGHAGCSPGACLLLPGVVVHSNDPPDEHNYVDNNLEQSFPLLPTQSGCST
jgi:hypothetical protein